MLNSYDFARLRVLAEAGAFFVTRTKAGVLFSRQESMPVDKSTSVRSDHVVLLVTAASFKNYPERMRRVAYRDPEDGKVLVFLTNNSVLPAFKIAAIYKLRWRVELLAGYSPVIAINSAGRRQLIVWTGEAMCALNPEDGSVFWHMKRTLAWDQAISVPVLHPGLNVVLFPSDREGCIGLQLGRDKPAASVVLV